MPISAQFYQMLWWDINEASSEKSSSSAGEAASSDCCLANAGGQTFSASVRTDLTTIADLSLEPPRSNLIKQKGNCCMLYAILNSFSTMKEVCQFLNIPEKDKIEEADLQGILDFMKTELEIDVAKDGMSSMDVGNLLSNPKFKTFARLHSYVWRSTRMDLHQLLATSREERYNRYLCTGQNTSDHGKRNKATQNIIQFVSGVEEPKKDEEIFVGVKRKTSGKGRGRKKPKVGFTSEEKASLTNKKKLWKELNQGIAVHSDQDYKLTKNNSTVHASLIYYNKSGIPFRYDGGLPQITCMLPGNKDTVFTRGEIQYAVEGFVTSMVLLDRVFRLRIVLEGFENIENLSNGVVDNDKVN